MSLDNSLNSVVCDGCGKRLEISGEKSRFDFQIKWAETPAADYCPECRDSEEARTWREITDLLAAKHLGMQESLAR